MQKIKPITTNTSKIISNLPKKEKPSMLELVKKHFNQIKLRAEREVPDYGDFASVYERFANPDNNFKASDFIIKIVKPPKNITNNEKIRNLEIVAYNLPSTYKASAIIATGTKEELLKKFNDENICKEIEMGLKSLAKDLEI